MSISFSGLASGLDTSSWIESLVALKRAKVTTLQEERENILLSKDTLNSIKSFFNSFRSTIERITDTRFNIVSMDLFAQNIATSANLNVLTATATSEAEEGTYKVKVDKLATSTNAISNYKTITTTTVTATATEASYLKHIGVTAGSIAVTVNGVKQGLTITENDTIATFIEKLKNIGVEASFSKTTGVFSMNISANDIDDSISNTRIVEKLHLGGVNEGYKTQDKLEFEKETVEFVNADDTTKLKDLGVNAGTINVFANGQDNEITITEDTSIADFVTALQDKFIDASYDEATGIFTLENAEITAENGTDIINALGLTSDVYSKSQSSSNLSLETVKTETTVANSDTFLKDIGSGTAIVDGDTVIVRNSNNEFTTITVGTESTIGDLLGAMVDAGLSATIKSDGTVHISGGEISGGSFNAISAFGLETEPFSAMTTGNPLTETIVHRELVTLDTKLVDDLGVKEGYLKVTDANGDTYYEKIYSGQTIADFMADMGNLGIHTSLDESTGILTITGGAFDTLTDAEVQLLVDNLTIAEADSRFIQGTNLLECLYGSDVISVDNIDIASTYARSKALSTSVTSESNADLTTDLERLGLTTEGTAIFNSKGTEVTIDVTKTMSIQDLRNALADKGISTEWDSSSAKLTINNATLIGGTSDLGSVLNLTEVIAGKYATSTALYATTTSNITATDSTLLSELGINGSQTVILHAETGESHTFTVDGTNSIAELLGEINTLGVSATFDNGIIKIENGYIENSAIESALGLEKTVSGESTVLGTALSRTVTTTATSESTLGEVIAALGTEDQVTGGYNLTFNGSALTVDENTTIDELMAQIYQNNGSSWIDTSGRIHIGGGVLSGSVADALGFTSITTTASVSGTGEVLQTVATVNAETTTTLGTLNIGDTVITIKDSSGAEVGTINTNANMTLGELFDELADNGINAKIENGVISLTSPNGNYAIGDAMDTLGIGFENITYTTTTGTTNTSSVAITFTQTVYADTSQTLDELGICPWFGSTIIQQTQAEAEAAGYTWVTTVNELKIALQNNENIMLGADIDMSGATWDIYTYSNVTLDGNGYAIKNLELDRNSFIGTLQNSTIKNLGFENVTMEGGSSAAGIIAGAATDSTIENCYVIDSTAQGRYASGFVGSATNLTIINSNIYNTTLNGDEGTAGFVRQLVSYNLNISNSNIYNSTINSSSGNNGGIIGAIGSSHGNIIISDTNLDIEFNGSGNSGYIAGSIFASSLCQITNSTYNSNIDTAFGHNNSGTPTGAFTKNTNIGILTVNDSTGNAIATIDVSPNTSLAEIFADLSTYGISASITNGIINLSSDEGRYITGSVAEAFGIGTIETTTTVTVGIANSSTIPITTTQNKTITGSTTVGELGADETVINIHSASGVTIGSITTEAEMTISDIFSALGAYGISGTVRDGVIHLDSVGGNYTSGGILETLGVGTGLTTVTVTRTSNTSTATVTFTGSVLADGSTTLGDLNITATELIVNLANGSAQPLTFTSDSKISDIFNTLSGYEIYGSIRNGVIELTSSKGAYVTGELADALGIETAETVVTIIPDKTYTSTTAITYTETAIASGTTKLSEIGVHTSSLTQAEAEALGYTWVTTASELKTALANATADSKIMLGADIDLTGETWSNVEFRGIFDGNYHTLSGLTRQVTGSNGYGYGFFESIMGDAEVKNLTLDSFTIIVNATIGTGTLKAGILAGSVGAQAKIDNITVNNSYVKVEDDSISYVGGLVGQTTTTFYGSITNSKVINTDINVNSSVGGYIGGIIGNTASSSSDEGEFLANLLSSNCNITVSDQGVAHTATYMLGGVIGNNVNKQLEVINVQSENFSTDTTGLTQITSSNFYEGAIIGKSSNSTVINSTYESANISKDTSIGNNNNAEIYNVQKGTVSDTIQNNNIFVMNSSGTAVGTITVSNTTTLDTLVQELNQHGFNAELNSGLLTISPTDGKYLLGTVASQLGLDTVASVEKATIGVTSTSTAQITYTQEIDATLQDSVMAFANNYTIDGTMTASSITGTVIGISTAEDLANLAACVNSGVDTTGKTFVLMNDIDLSGYAEWVSIGASNEFKGTFDGNGYTISNLTQTSVTRNSLPGTYVAGLFGVVRGATIKNVKLENFNITFTAQIGTTVGALVGNASSLTATILDNIVAENITITSTSQASDVKLGGIAGSINGSVSNIRAYSGTVLAPADTNGATGGLFGEITSSNIQYCYNAINISGQHTYTGGIAGKYYNASDTSPYINHVANTGNFNTSFSIVNAAESDYGAGGLFGYLKDTYNGISDNITIGYCYNTGEFVGPSSSSSYSEFVYEHSGAGTLNGYSSYCLTPDKDEVVVGTSSFNITTPMTEESLYQTMTTSSVNYTMEDGIAVPNPAELTVYSSNGTNVGKVQVDIGTSFEELFADLSSYGINCTLENGVITVESSNGNCVGGAMWEALGFTLTKTTTSVTNTIAKTVTSSTKVTYTETTAADATTTLASLKYVIDGSITASSVTGTVIAISTDAQLKYLANQVNAGNNMSGKTFVLTGDIDLSAYADWEAIGNQNNTFRGTFDGMGHTISNMTQNVSTADTTDTFAYGGLFGCIDPGSKILNVKIKDATITSENQDTSHAVRIGGLVGQAYSATISGITVENVNITGTVNSEIGGILGTTSGSVTIKNSSTSGIITSSFATQSGGIVGWVQNSLGISIDNCQNEIDIDTHGSTGGIIGLLDQTSGTITVSNTLNKGDITNNTNSAAGIVGMIRATSTSASTINISNSVNAGKITGASGAADFAVLGSWTTSAATTSTITLTNCYGYYTTTTKTTDAIVISTGLSDTSYWENMMGNSKITQTGVERNLAISTLYSNIRTNFDKEKWSAGASIANINLKTGDEFDMWICNEAYGVTTIAIDLTGSSTLGDVANALSAKGNAFVDNGIIYYEPNPATLVVMGTGASIVNSTTSLMEKSVATLTSDTTMKDLGLTSTYYLTIKQTGTATDNVITVKSDQTIGDLMTQLSGYGFASSITGGRLTVKSNGDYYVYSGTTTLESKLKIDFATGKSFTTNITKTTAYVSSTESNELTQLKDTQLETSTKLSDLGITTNQIVTVVQNGTETTFTFSSDKTVSDILTALAGKGISGTVNDGKLSLYGTESSYIKGMSSTLKTALKQDKFTTVSTSATITNTNSNALNSSWTETIDGSTKFSQIGITENAYITINSGGTNQIITVTPDKTVGDIASTLAGYGIVCSIDDGKITLKGNNGNTVLGVSDELKVALSLKASLNSNVVTFATPENTFQDIGIEGSGYRFGYTVFDANGNCLGDHTCNVGEKIQDFLDFLHTDYGFTYTMEEGVITLNSADGRYIVIDENGAGLGINTVTETTSSTTGITLTSADKITYSSAKISNDTLISSLHPSWINGSDDRVQYIKDSAGNILASITFAADATVEDVFGSSFFSDYGITYSINQSTGNITLTSTEGYNWIGTSSGCLTNQLFGAGFSGIGSSITSYDIDSNTTRYINEDSTFAELGVSHAGMTIAYNNGANIASFDVSNYTTIGEWLDDMSTYGVNGSVVDGKIIIEFEEGSWANEAEGLEGIGISTFSSPKYEVVTKTTGYNTSSNLLIVGDVTKTIISNTTSEQLEYYEDGELVSGVKVGDLYSTLPDSVQTITVMSNGTVHNITVTESQTIGDVLTSLAGLGIYGSIVDGKLTLAGSENSYIMGITQELKEALKLGDTTTSTVEVEQTLNTDSTVTTYEKNELITEDMNVLDVINEIINLTNPPYGNRPDYYTIDGVHNGISFSYTIPENKTFADVFDELERNYGIKGSIKNGKITFEGTEGSYITNLGSVIRDAFWLNNNTSANYTVIEETTTVNTASDPLKNSTGVVNLNSNTTIGSLHKDIAWPEQTISLSSNGNLYTITVSDTQTVGDLLTTLASYGIHGQVADGKITLSGDEKAYITGISDELRSALALGDIFYGTVENSRTENTNSTQQKEIITKSANGLTKLEDLRDSDGNAPAGYELELSYTHEGVNSTITITCTATTTMHDLIDALELYGIKANIDSAGRFSMSSTTLTDFDIAGDLGTFLKGDSFSKAFLEEIIENTSTTLSSQTVAVMADNTKLSELGISTGEIILNKNGALHTITVTDTQTVGDFRSQLGALGINSTIIEGKLQLISTGVVYLEAPETNASNLVEKMGLGKDKWSFGDYSQKSDMLAGVADTITAAATMGCKIKDLTDQNGVSLGVTDGQIYVYQDGVRNVVDINTEESLQDLARKLKDYDIEVGISSTGELYFNGNNNSYLTTDGLAVDDASNILTALGISTWETRLNSVSERLGYESDGSAEVNGSTKLVDLEDASGNNLGITEGAYYIYQNGVRNTETISADTTLNDFRATMASYGLVTDFNEDGTLSVSGYNETYLATSALAGSNTNAIDVLFEEWDFVNIYTTNNLDIPTNVSVAITETTKLKDINEGTYQAGYITVVRDGVQTNIELTEDDTVGDLMNELELYGFESYINSNGQLILKNTGYSSLQEYTGAETASNVLDLLGVDPDSWTCTNTYDGETVSIVTTTTEDVSATRDTLLKDLGVTTGEYYIYKNGVKYTTYVSSDETVGSLLETLKSYGIETSLVDTGSGSVIHINGNGNSYVAKSNNASASNIVDTLFSSGVIENLRYESESQQKSVTITSTATATESTLLSEFNIAEDAANGIVAKNAEGNLVINIDGFDNTIQITADDTIGDLINKLDAYGLKASISDGNLVIESGYKDISIVTTGTTGESGIVDTLKLQYNNDLGGYASSSVVVEDTQTIIEEKTLSVANYANESTVMDLLNISSGTLTVYRDGEKATIQINSNQTFGELNSLISGSFSARDVAIKFEDGYLTFYSTTDGVAVEVGATTDTSNFAAITGITNDGSGVVKSARELYCVNSNSLVTTSGLFRNGDVTEGTFKIGDATFEITSTTRLSDLISQINASQSANATAYWDSIDGKLVIQSRTTGSALINIEAGTSNFTDKMGFTSSEWTNTDTDGDGFNDLSVTKINTATQEIGDNAKFSINGTYYTSTKNEIGSDVSRIKGLTINLKGISEGETTITVERDKETVANAVSDVVDAYNQLIENVDKEIAKGAPLDDQFTLKLIRNQIRSLMTGAISGLGAFSNLDAIGISLEKASANNISTANIDKLSFDKDKFLKAFDSDRDSLKALIVGTDTKQGIFQQVENVIEQAVTIGYFTSAERSFNNQISRIDNKIDKALRAVDKYKERLEAKFASMDLLISKMQNQYSSFLGV